MLAIGAAQSVAQHVDPPDVVVAIIGGTMLTLALTRPRLRWMEQLTEDSRTNRLWTERALTVFAFAMGGYAWTSLFLVLHRQLGAEIDTLLRGAGCFMIVYAWLVHFEPFLAEWRLRGWLGAVALYTGVAIFAASVGLVVADVILLSSFTIENLRFLSITGALAGGGWLVYRLIPRLEARMDRLVPRRTPRHRSSPEPSRLQTRSVSSRRD
jgi:uncharacterized membrane protein